jgi:flagellar basal body rod protein FlgB
VRFEDLLTKAIRSSNRVDPRDIEPEIYQPGNTPIRSNGNDVNMEAEIGEMLKNSLRHTAYVRLLRKKLAQMEIAMGVGG